MTFDQYYQNIFLRFLSNKKRSLRGAKLKILQRLWVDDTEGFPKPWVAGSELLQLTGQSYYDRRIRELRDEVGCDIAVEYRQELGGYAYRLASEYLSLPQDRDYLSEKQKQRLFARHNYTCAVCGERVAPGLKGLQADHKIPVSRNGSNDELNWQPLCVKCNVGKRRACSGCQVDCMTCSWAYPDVIGINTMLSMRNAVLDRVDQYAKQREITRDEVIETALEFYLERTAAH